MRTQTIHGDISAHNVLVDPEADQYVVGIIDFGDLHRGPAVCDLAVALANALDHRAVDPWARATTHLRGFLHEATLAPVEAGVLPLAVVGRSLQRALIAQWRAEHVPARAAYVLEHAMDDWANIEVAFESLDSALKLFTQIAAETPCLPTGAH